MSDTPKAAVVAALALAAEGLRNWGVSNWAAVLSRPIPRDGPTRSSSNDGYCDTGLDPLDELDEELRPLDMLSGIVFICSWSKPKPVLPVLP